MIILNSNYFMPITSLSSINNILNYGIKREPYIFKDNCEQIFKFGINIRL